MLWRLQYAFDAIWLGLILTPRERRRWIWDAMILRSVFRSYVPPYQDAGWCVFWSKMP